jgi:hypothetical protein
MKLHRIRWKPAASAQARSVCVFWLEIMNGHFVVPLRSDGRPALTYRRSPIWLVL